MSLLCEIITVGDEILSGFIVNTNAAFIGKKLAGLGFDVRWMTTVGDDETELLSAFDQAFNRASVTIVTGGLGPTHDDVTRNVLVKYFNTRLIFCSDILKKLEDLFKRLERKMSDINREQALVPESAELMENTEGSAPGLIFSQNDKLLFALPGVQIEMQTLMNKSVLPRLEKYSDGKGVYYRELRTTNIAESNLAEKITGFTDQFPQIKLAFLPQRTGVQMRLRVDGFSEKESNRLLDQGEAFICSKTEPYVYGSGDDSLESIVGELLKSNKRTLAIAESCTGGLITHKLTNIPGSSEYIERAVVSYSNTAKMEMLRVPETVIHNFGAVSPQTALAMAEGVRQISQTDIGLSVTGIAGPGGGSEEKPVGLVYIGYVDENGSLHEKHLYLRDRVWNKERAALSALDLVRRVLTGHVVPDKK